MATMDSIRLVNKQQIRYVNARLVEPEDSDNTLQLEAGEDEFNVNLAYADDGQTVYVQQGQYVIPVDGRTVVLQDGQGDFEQYIINNIVTDDDLQDGDQTEQEMNQPVFYYTGELMDPSQMLEEGDELPEGVDEGSLSAVIPLSKRIKIEQGYLDQQDLGDIEGSFLELNEENTGGGEIMVAAASGNVQLQRPQYQYAILRNGKLHLQTLDMTAATDAAVSSGQLAVLEDGPEHLQLQEQLAAFQQSLSMDEATGATGTAAVDLEKITGKNLITGQTVTLDTYFDKLQRRIATSDVGDQCFTSKVKRKRMDSSGSIQRTARVPTEDSFINKKVVVGKTSSGKRIVGKILRVHRTGGGEPVDVGKECNNGSDRRETSSVPTNAVELPTIASVSTLSSSGELGDNSNDLESESCESPVPVEWDGPTTDSLEDSLPSLQPHIIIKKHIVSRENFEYSVGKTLTGLMSLETVQRRLQDKNLMVKLVEKMYDHKAEAFNRTVSYVYGHMELVRLGKEGPECERWAFVLHSEKTANEKIYAEADAACLRDSPSLDETNEPEPSPLATKKQGLLSEEDEPAESDEIKDVSLELEDWNRQSETASLTIVITVDKSGKKSTRVNLTPQQPDSRCHLCSKEFKTPLQMRKHLNNVHLCERSAKCELCGKTFANHTVLQRHRKIHTGERWYQCSKCLKSFNTAGSLKRHLTIHDPSLRPLECSVCVQRFTDESSLRKHLLIHTGIRAYACEVCNRAFINQGDLNFHRRIHDPVKQFSCEVCGREFSRHSNLMRHAEIHRGAGALHRCDICGCSYSFVSSLTRHIVQKHIGQQQQ